jgi:hypothetical protein
MRMYLPGIDSVDRKKSYGIGLATVIRRYGAVKEFFSPPNNLYTVSMPGAIEYYQVGQMILIQGEELPLIITKIEKPWITVRRMHRFWRIAYRLRELFA